MKRWLKLTQFTMFEVLQDSVFRILLFLTVVVPFISALVASLFLYDIGKVYIDIVIGLMHLLAIAYILFVSVSLLSRDVEQKFCYLLLAKPVNRALYLISRFSGLLICLLFLFLLLFASSAAMGVWYTDSLDEVYRSSFSWEALFGIIILHFFQYLGVLGAVFFIFSWATGAAEIMFFSLSVILLTWIFPPILLVSQQSAVAETLPTYLFQTLDFLYQLLPHLNASSISLALAHGKDLAQLDVFLYVGEHLSYAAVSFILALWKFSKRDL